MKSRITLDTTSDIYEFVAIVSKIPHKVLLVSGKGLRVNAKSILGVLASLTFNELWVECEINIYSHIQKFMKIESKVIDKSALQEEFWLNGFTY